MTAKLLRCARIAQRFLVLQRHSLRNMKSGWTFLGEIKGLGSDPTTPGTPVQLSRPWLILGAAKTHVWQVDCTLQLFHPQQRDNSSELDTKFIPALIER